MLKPFVMDIHNARIGHKVQYLQKNNVDNKARFRYLDGYWFRLMNVSICCASAEADTRLTVFDSSVSKKQLLIFYL